MPTPAHLRFSFRSTLRRYRRDRGGSTIVEFAIIAPIFFALLFAIIESALMFFAGQLLETIAEDSARVIMTGQAQTLPICQMDGDPTPQACNQETFKTLVCSKIPALFDCHRLAVDVRSYAAGFTGVTNPNYVNASKNFVPTTGYDPGGPNSIVVVQLFYQWPQVVTGLGFDYTNLAGNMRLLVATAAFKNEPYIASGAGGAGGAGGP